LLGLLVFQQASILPRSDHGGSAQTDLIEPPPGRYNAQVISRGIREFVSRDWAAARNSKDTYWAERITRLGPLEGLRIADELRRQALLCDAGWPHAAARREDLLSHVHLAELLRRATPTRRP
jgi:hypothetical protein